MKRIASCLIPAALVILSQWPLFAQQGINVGTVASNKIVTIGGATPVEVLSANANRTWAALKVCTNSTWGIIFIEVQSGISATNYYVVPVAGTTNFYSGLSGMTNMLWLQRTNYPPFGTRLAPGAVYEWDGNMLWRGSIWAISDAPNGVASNALVEIKDIGNR